MCTSINTPLPTTYDTKSDCLLALIYNDAVDDSDVVIINWPDDAESADAESADAESEVNSGSR